MQELESALAQAIAQAEAAVAAEYNAAMAACRQRFAALNSSLEERYSAVEAVKARFERELGAAWEDYSEVYVQVDVVKQVGAVEGWRHSRACMWEQYRM